MLRYTKTLSLALLFSLPAIAMEAAKEQALSIVQEQEAASTTLAPVMVQTVNLRDGYKKEQAHLAELTKQEEALKEAKAKAAEAAKKFQEDLKGRLADKEKAREGARLQIATLSAALTVLQEERTKKAQEIIDKAHLDVAAYNSEADKKAQSLTAQKEKAEKEVTSYEAEIADLNKEFAPTAQGETPKKTGLFAWLKWS